MRGAILVSSISLVIAGTGLALVASCGAMAFELPPEEPLPEASAPPRLVRREAGSAELGHPTPPQ